MEKSNEIRAGGSCQCRTFRAICLVVKVRALQIFLFVTITLLVPAALLRGTLSTGATYPISFVDIDGNKLSTADGHVTIVVLTTTAERAKGAHRG